MDSEEMIGQRRYFSSTGTAPLTCDRCGLPVDRAQTVVVDGRAGLAEPIEDVALCSSCLTLIEQGLEPVDLADEDE